MNQIVQILRRLLLTINWIACGFFVLMMSNIIIIWSETEGVPLSELLKACGLLISTPIVGYICHRLINWIFIGSQKTNYIKCIYLSIKS